MSGLIAGGFMRTLWVVSGLLLGVMAGRSTGQEPSSEAQIPDEGALTISDEEFRVPISDKLAAEVDELIVELSSPEYALREEATEGLVEIGVPAFSQLRAAYRATDELEIRLRIEQVVKEAYLDSHVFNKNAFLGIRHQFKSVVHADDPRVGEGHFGVTVDTVLERTAAAEAGLVPGDVIIGLDRAPLVGTTGEPTLSFGESIRLRGPGTPVTLTVLRGPETLELVAVLRPRPKEHYQQRGAVVTTMLMEAKQRFRIWWHLHFAGLPSPERTAADR
ncbi:MAG: PDZ domain-containing protein [Phycisphaerae bacterium]